MAAMEERGMKKLALKEKSGFEIELERSSTFEVEPYSLSSNQEAALPRIPTQATQETEEKEERVPEKLEVKEGSKISSPMVGTFYAAPSQDLEPFVKVGDTVNEETVVCIIEAMKVMNEVKAGKSGVVAEILVEDAHPVDFGHHLFRIV